MPKIYCFINGRPPGSEPGDVHVSALAEDGTLLAEHTSSNESFARLDIGVTGQRKHDLYLAHYPGGYEVEWVDEPKVHLAFNAAYLKHVESFRG